MNKQQAQRIIKEAFENPFDKSRFANFVRNLLKKAGDAPFTYHGNLIPDSYKPFISKYERIAKYHDGENRIDVLIVHLNREKSIERARSMQRNFVAGYLQGRYGSSKDKEAAIVAFVSPDETDWRFSLVKMDYRFEESSTGKMKVKEEFTPARRWSFLVGCHEASHTAQSRLVKLLADDEHNPTLKQLEEAFNIETVTKEFFLRYRDLFIRTKEELDKVLEKSPKIKADLYAKAVNTVDFAKKLLGQIVFLYFLQKKGWFGVGRDADWGTGSKQFLRELFEKKHRDFKNFFNDILEPLFYDALRRDRSEDDHYYPYFNCKIPFLNGGLFDPIGSNGGYDWTRTDILLPDSLFSNKTKTKEGDLGDGILDVFDRYNFTVKEDEPLEKEVAIDPELLGKAYEKFNAIRPDNFQAYKKALKSGQKGEESKFNKQYGVYYTPREIVHYMCQQSLIQYLYTELNTGPVSYERLGESNLDMLGNEGRVGQQELHIEHRPTPRILQEEIESFIHYGEQLGEREAFIESRGKETKTYRHQLADSIRASAEKIDRKLAEITVCDPAVGSGAFPVGMMSEIVKARTVLTTFVENMANRSPYDFKRRCIEHSLYGVDIDSGAVEIAKLRLWLSLVVDEEDIHNIKPLPNLDYRIVCGNSLLGLPDLAMRDLQLESEIEQLKLNYFNETNPTNKRVLRDRVDQTFKKLVQSAREYSSGILETDFDFKIHFSEVFHDKGGFDVVIANPPYVRQEAIRDIKPHLAKAFGDFFCGTADIYTYFYKCGIDLLKHLGHLCFIAPNKFMRAGYGKNTRVLLSTRVTPKLIIDFGDLPIFEATTYPSIILIEKRKPIAHDKAAAATFIEEKQLERLNETLTHIGFPMPVSALNEDGWNLEQPQVLALVEKLKSKGVPLGEYVQGRFYRGILTGLNEAFVIDSRTREKLIAEDATSAELIKPWLRGRDIHRWKAEWAGLYVIFTRRGVDIGKYPAIEQRLSQFKKDLMPKKSDKQKQGRKPGSYQWYEIQDNIAYWKEFEQWKIVIPAIAQNVQYAIDFEGFYGNDKTSICIADNAKIVAALLNSKLLWWFIRQIAAARQNGFYEFKPMYVSQIPIAVGFQSEEIERLVEQILDTKEKNQDADVIGLEREIDQMVYQLYGLTEAEIAIVEGKK